MNKPIRIQRKRTKGFNLQAQSPDGRPVVSVCRPGKWGNPFKIGKWASMGGKTGACWYLVGDKAADTGEWWLVNSPHTAVDIYGWWLELSKPDLADLRGKHLACFCALDAPCHADVLLELANA
ncbi:DUF4326 domain-containing protein [Hymenobacter aerilatus]|uniref:DUF4326 domain-containing protein n=1 Tax=Hymenobacter aerilatus TaxID=2932251 RepID=A0A8T9T515_9BACT|nr:DUF4326 domain-containing protein [Hymenobacter aerilatus]UOR07196.1 DUF4326 domain-containing protein [Hymenobacter aerilatus]